MSTELAWLKEQLDVAVAGLGGVTVKRMFGCDAYFREGRIFSMVWKEGRIAVKLTDTASHAALAAIRGVQPWSPGGKMVMTAWLLVPPGWNEDPDTFRPWVERAFEQVAAQKVKPAPKKRSAPKTKAVAKKTTAIAKKRAAR